MSKFKVFLVFSATWNTPDGTFVGGLTSEQFDMEANNQGAVEYHCGQIVEEMERQGTGVTFSILRLH